MVSADGGVFLVSSGCEQVSTFHSRDIFFPKVKAFTRTKAFLKSLQESIRGTATTAGLNHKTADVNTRVFSYALSVNSAWTSESVDVNLKEKRSTVMS